MIDLLQIFERYERRFVVHILIALSTIWGICDAEQLGSRNAIAEKIQIAFSGIATIVTLPHGFDMFGI